MLESARCAQKQWRESSFKTRRAVMQDLMDVLVEDQEEIVRKVCQETGKTPMEAEMGGLVIFASNGPSELFAM